MLPSLLLSSLLAAAPAPAGGPSADEAALLLESVQPREREALKKAVGGLEKLPLYRVQVALDPPGHGFAGQEQIRYPTAAPLAELPLRLFNNASYVGGGGLIKLANVQCPGAKCSLVETPEPTLYKVRFDPPVPAGGVAQVDLDFLGAAPKIDDAKLTTAAQMQAQLGMVNGHSGPSDHGAFSDALGVLALTGLFPQVALRTGEGFDTGTPTGVGDVASYDPSNYLFSATVPQGFKVVASGAALGEAPTPDGKVQFSFAAAAVRDFAVYASDQWKEESTQAGPVKVTAYTLPGDEANGKKALDVASRALKEFSKRFGSYPWASFKVVEQGLTEGAGGIEYPTVVGVASLLYRSDAAMGPLAALVGQQQSQLGSREANLSMGDKLLEFTVAHEVAHQWWSILVGSDPHLHPAVDEPLTQYSAYLYLESRRGKKAADEALEGQVAMNYQMMRQAGEPDGPADQPTGSYASALQYAGLVYGKAPLFYRAARKQLGDAAFNKALARYASKYRFGSAPADGFVQAAREVAPKSGDKLAALRAHWLDEAHGDQDVGQLDMGRLVEASTGMHLSAEEKAAMQQLMPALMQMLQSGADPTQLLGNPPPAAKPGKAGAKQPAPPQGVDLGVDEDGE